MLFEVIIFIFQQTIRIFMCVDLSNRDVYVQQVVKSNEALAKTLVNYKKQQEHVIKLMLSA
jgi:hypothetical protein